MIDYSKRLVSLSWQMLTPGECLAVATSDAINDFRVYRSTMIPDQHQIFDPIGKSFHEFRNDEDDCLDCLRVDLLRPTYDYFNLKYDSFEFLLLEIELFVAGCVKTHMKVPDWHMICCTTRNDSPVSAVRRTMIFLSKNLAGEPVACLPLPREIPIGIIEQIELEIERHLMLRAPEEHYA